MEHDNIRERIQGSLAAIPSSDFAAKGRELLAALGYSSELTLDNQSGTVDDFVSRFPAPNPDTKSERVFRQNVESVRIVFQLTEQEITPAVQHSLFNAGDFDSGNLRSFLFAAVELNDDSYPRTKYAAFAREINKRWQIPTVVLFKTATEFLSLAFVHRREHKRNPDRDVLGRVSLVREIDPMQPHQAHIRILEELSLVDRLKWMDSRRKPHNFDGLLTAWLDALDTEELNKRFYKELFAWFERAVTVARYPKTGSRVLDPEEHIIRLITRLLFVWFIKEKNLIADDLFNEAQVRSLLRDYNQSSGDSYYRAVLQNLFFATLNTEIDRRGFSRQTNATHRDFSRYRYKDEMGHPERLLALFRQTPFINGGLFDCLDSEAAAKDGGYRIDCFTDNVTDPRREEFGILSIPNRLFFDECWADYAVQSIQVHGRGEHAGRAGSGSGSGAAWARCFENLLGRPTTPETSRDRPQADRLPTTLHEPVVDFMVDEALVATMARKVSRRTTVTTTSGRSVCAIS